MINLQLQKIRNVSWQMLYFILVAFVLVNINLFVNSTQATIYTSIIVIYTLLTLVFRATIPDTSIFQTIGRDLLWTAIFYFVLTVLPIQQLGIATTFTFGSTLFAWLFFIVVGFSETLIYTIALPQKLGIFWSSIIFSIMHVTTNFIVVQHFDIYASLILFLAQFVANILFYMVYVRSNSLFLTSMLHAMIDLSKLGLLGVII
jgi:membrane protease YdiL (CAAX protease family)